METMLVKFEAAELALAKAETLIEFKNVRDQAEALLMQSTFLLEREEKTTMNALLKIVVENTGLIVEQAEQAIDTIVTYFEQRLPDPFPKLMAELLDEGNSQEQALSQEQGPGETLVPTVHLTGMSVPQFNEAIASKKAVTQCIICKRMHGAPAIAFTDDNKSITYRLEIFSYKKRCGDVIYTFPICGECAWLTGIFS